MPLSWLLGPSGLGHGLGFGRGDRAVGRWLPVESRVLGEDGGLQVSQLLPRLDPEVLVEEGPDLPDHVQRLGLSTGTSESEGPEGPRALPQRMLADECLRFGGCHGVLAPGQVHDDAVLLRHRAQLLEPGSLRDCLWRVLQVRVGRPPPECERGVERLQGGSQARLVERGDEGAVAAEATVGGPDEPLEACCVEGVVGKPERVSGCHRDEHGGRGARRAVRLEDPPQPGDVGLERSGHSDRWPFRPQGVDDGVDRHWSPRGERQTRDEGALLARAQVDGAVLP